MKLLNFLLSASVAMVFVSCEKDVSVSPEDLPPHTGFAYVSSIPSGAEIYLNSKNTGRYTPDSLRWLEGGSYSLALKLKRFRDTSVTVDIVEGKKENVSVDYTANPLMRGNISISSLPDKAAIYIDSAFTGYYTPASFPAVMPGAYKLQLKLTNHWDFDQNIEVYSSKTTSVYKKLVDSTLWVNYNNTNSLMSSNFLTCLALDKNGARWIGTKENGLMVSSGTGYITYNTSNSVLPGNVITAVFVDNSDRKWIGTKNEGLVCIDASNNWQVYNTSNSHLGANDIQCIKQDKAGNVYAGTATKGVSVFNGSSWSIISSETYGIPGNNIQAVEFDGSNNIWLGVKYYGLVRISGRTVTAFNRSNSGLPNNNVKCITADNSGNIWAGCLTESPYNGGLAVFDGSSISQVSTGSNNILSILPDSYGNKWIITGDTGFLKISGGSVTKFTSTNSVIPDRLLSSGTIDAQGTKWITTLGNGIIKYKGN